MSPKKSDNLNRIAASIAERTPIDWDLETQDHPRLAPELAGLRLIEKIAEVHRTPLDVAGGPWPAAESPRPFLFAWGPLQVMAKIGAGSYGSVWHAYDPNLERDVALKLLHEDLATRHLNTQRFLEEARRMARVRHPNVLVIHGVAQHGTRAGFWTDLVRGETLEERLRASGPLGAEEAALVGIALCQALAAVHAAGLVHGDVKTTNVMRDDRGRILLMDFGAGSERLGHGAAAGSMIGTPLILAPEVFHGEAPTLASDIYALGVLLYRLVSGRYPLPAKDGAELEAMHRRGERVPLRDVRPDLPALFVALIERATASQPAERFRSAGEMEAALIRFLAPTVGAGDQAARLARVLRRPPGTSRPSLRGVPAGWLAAALGLLVVAAAVVVLQWSRGRDHAGGPGYVPPSAQGAIPGAAMRGDGQLPVTPGESQTAGLRAMLTAATVEAALCRSRGGAKEVLAAGALVRPGDALYLELSVSQSVHVYVLNEDAQGNVVALFPLEGLELTNPLGPGAWHRLPGSRQGTLLDWEMGGGPGPEGFLVVAAREPLSRLGEWLATLPPVEAEPGRTAAADPAERQGTRGISGTVPVSGAMEAESSSRLAGLARSLAEQSAHPGGLWMRHIVLYNTGS